MTPQATIKLPLTELPVGVLDKPEFWCLILCLILLVLIVKKGSR